MTLTAKQRAILRYIQTFTTAKGYPPAIRDLQRGCQISSTSVVKYNLAKLEAAALIRREDRVARSLVLTDQGARYV